ncbi:Com family DNA-binding transcriptional regulator [Cognatishimia sp. MH4019]|uniref:Com family DNA-binding transcriptional regulator n=1 Tax=Cognatishimia sp. MH4019 TaxID=2854030 RepID=UPI001CD44C41
MRQEEIRCTHCAKLLFKMEPDGLVGVLSIKCPRCRNINVLRPVRTDRQSPEPERHECDGKEASCGFSSRTRR